LFADLAVPLAPHPLPQPLLRRHALLWLVVFAAPLLTGLIQKADVHFANNLVPNRPLAFLVAAAADAYAKGM